MRCERKSKRDPWLFPGHALLNIDILHVWPTASDSVPQLRFLIEDLYVSDLHCMEFPSTLGRIAANKYQMLTMAPLYGLAALVSNRLRPATVMLDVEFC